MEHPFLKPLAIVFKKYFALKNLNSPFQGTLSSYGMVLMLLALIKDLKRSEHDLERGQDSVFESQLGKTFCHFLTVYGE